MIEAVDRTRRVIARVAVDRAIRLSGEAEPANERALPAPPKLICPKCGAVVAEGGRVKLFAGMVLSCNGCGTQIRG
jgi:hypothetical protein